MAARAAEKAVSCSDQKASEIHELAVIKELHLRTVDELGLDNSIVSGLLNDLEQNLQYVAWTKELTPTKRHYLVAFGERMSTTIFSAYLNKLGKRTRQYAFDIDFKTTDDFRNVDILEATYASIAKKLKGALIVDPAIHIVTCSYGEGIKSCAITTLGSDLNAMIIGKALGSGEIKIWKDVDVVLTGDPNICTNAIPVSNLTFAEATELAYSGAQVLHPQSMRLASGGGIPVIKVKNSYNPQSPGTMITETRDMSKSILSSIVLKSNISMFNIVSTGVLGQQDFEAQVFSIFKDQQISIDHEATSGRNICLTLDLSKLSSHELIQRKLDTVAEELEKVAVVLRQQQSIISLVGNIRKSSFILGKAFSALERIGVNAQKVSQISSKVMNVSLVVHDSEAKRCVQVLHSAFLEDGFLSKVEGADNEGPIPVNSSAEQARSGDKRKAVDDHPEAPPSARHERADTEPIGLEETDRMTFSQNDLTQAGDGNGGALDASVFEVQPEQQELTEVAEGGSGPSNALEELELNLLSENDPMQAGDDNGGALDANAFEVLPEQQQGHTEVAEGGSGPSNALDELELNLLSEDDPMQAGDDNGGALDASAFEVQPEQLQVLTEVAEGGSGPCNALEELERNLLSEDDPMQAGGYNAGYPDACWARLVEGNYNLDTTGALPVGGGEQAMPQSAPGAVTEEDARQGSWPGPDCPEQTEHQLSPDNDLMAVGDPGVFSGSIVIEDYPGQLDIEGYTQRPINLDFDWYMVSASEAEPEQQVLAEGGSTVEEMLEEISPNVLLGPFPGAGFS